MERPAALPTMGDRPMTDSHEDISAKPSFLGKAQISQVAESLAEQVGLKPGGNISDAVHTLGGKINSYDYWKHPINSDGSLIVRDKGDFEIRIPLHTSAVRDRFTIAHELGHYILHYAWRRHIGDNIKQMRATRYGSDRAEWEANWFASAFLMPASVFRRSFTINRGKLALVAEEFRVSQKAAEVRAKALGLVTSSGDRK